MAAIQDDLDVVAAVVQHLYPGLHSLNDLQCLVKSNYYNNITKLSNRLNISLNKLSKNR